MRPLSASDFRCIVSCDHSPSYGLNAGGALFCYSWGGNVVYGMDIPALNEWYLLAITDADGTSQVRFHLYRYSTSSWTREDSVSVPDPSDPGAGALYLGATSDTLESWIGDIAIIGAWHSAALSDAQLDGMVSTLSAWQALSAQGLWLLDQTDVTVPVDDLTGNGASQSARAGTTVQAVSDLPFDVGDSGGAFRLSYPAVY